MLSDLLQGFKTSKHSLLLKPGVEVHKTAKTRSAVGQRWRFVAWQQKECKQCLYLWRCESSLVVPALMDCYKHVHIKLAVSVRMEGKKEMDKYRHSGFCLSLCLLAEKQVMAKKDFYLLNTYFSLSIKFYIESKN